MILIVITMAFILTIVGASSAATRDTDLSLSINPSNVNVGNDVTFTSRLTREDTNNGINGQTIHFFVYGTEVGTSNTQGFGSNTGTATYTYTPLTDGIRIDKHDTMEYQILPGPSDGYRSSTSPTRTLTVNVNRIPTGLTVNGPSGFNGDTVGFTATLVRQGTSTGIGNKPVTFTVNGVSNTVNTDVNGVATWNYLISNMPAGPYTILANFAQDDYYVASSNTGTLNVNRIPTSLTVNGPSGFNGDTVGFTATLVRQGTSTGIGNKPVTFTVNGVRYCEY